MGSERNSESDPQLNECDDDSPLLHRGVTAILESISSDRRLMSIRIKQEICAVQKHRSKNTFDQDQGELDFENEDPKLSTLSEIAESPEESNMEENAISRSTLDIDKYFHSTFQRILQHIPLKEFFLNLIL